jgi:hypothetical protein
MELTRVDEVTLEQAKKKDGYPDGQLEWWNFHKLVYLDFWFLSAACALGVCCTATIASRSDGGGARPLCSWDRGGNSGFDKYVQLSRYGNNDKAHGSGTLGTQHMTGARFALHRHKYTYLKPTIIRGSRPRL